MSIKNEKKEILTPNERPTHRVETFLYLRSMVTKEGGTEQNTNSRISKARPSFIQLYPVCKSKLLSFRSNIYLR